MKKYASKYSAGLVCLVLVDAMQLLLPQLVRRAVDSIASGTFRIPGILLIALQILVIAASISAGRYFWRLFIHGSSRRIEAELRERLFAHLLGLSGTFFRKNKTGDLMARATNDMGAVRQAAGMGLVAFVDGAFMSTAILAVMFARNPRVALLTVTPLPAITVLIVLFGMSIKKRFRAVQEAYGKLSELVQETLSGIRVIQGFVQERFFGEQFARANEAYKGENMRLVVIFGLFFPLINFLAGLSLAILIFAGGNSVLSGRMSPGELVETASYLEMLIWPMLGAGFTVNILQRGAASLKRINEILDAESDILSPAEPAALADAYPLEARNLSFRYPQANRDALRDVSFTLERGKTLGIIGRTGSGKSTLLKLLPRLEDPPPRTVFLGGTDIRDLDLAALRRALGFVPQETFLFSDSIRANVAYGNPRLDDGRLRAAEEISAIDRDLAAFPAGEDTVVGERGLTLSGGQKQRVSIARAIAADSEILVLDDSLSAVDAETEERILERVMRERAGRTTVIVSHRVSALRNADKILVLEDGGLVQSGTHEELMAQADGIYAEIARLQAYESGRA